MGKLKQFSNIHTPLVLTELKGFFEEKKKEATPLSAHLVDSIQNMEDFSLRGGKNLRSLLTIVGFYLAGGDHGNTAIYRVAAAVELFHKFIMSVDDIADRDEQRYGGPTLWKHYTDHFTQLKWQDPNHHGRTFAEINCVLFSAFVNELVRTADFPAPMLWEVLAVIDQLMYFQTVGGWEVHYFQNNQALAKANEAEFLKGLELVTAQYSFVAPLKIGAIVAGKGNDQQLLDVFTAYGHHIGRAFQMQDDILGVFGDPAETGKPVGNDIREGKKSLLLQRAYQTADAPEKKFLDKVCGHSLSKKELERVQEIINKTGSLEYSQSLANESIQKGLRALEKISLPLAEKEVLIELAHFVISRNK